GGHRARAARAQRRGEDTLVRILATLLRPSAGRATVLGHDDVAEPLGVRRRFGLAGQAAAVDGELTGRENHEMIGRLYRLSRDEARRRAADVLERFGLVEAADRAVSTYSGGMRRRLDLGASLAGRPPALTTGQGDALPSVLGTLAWLAGLLLVLVPLAVRAFRRA
ncbi:MAG TPA: ATP-binding cassette domain-containing protein, partial [Solirubrobacteraceae bacterium]